MTPKTIEVEKGNEFKIKIREIPSEGNSNAFAGDIFGDAYIQATARVEEIVTATDNINDDKSQDNYLNNIIAFTGERGQGKSSAMLSFTHYLENVSKIEAFKTNTKKYNFISLETVDPSTFEDMHNILEVVIARMYNNFSTKYKKDNTSISRDKKNEINELFQKTYESLCLIRNPKKLEELEYDYEGSIQKIAQIGDSTNLHKILQKLIKSYLSIMTEGNCKSFLIIPIDDLDINIKYAYKITEQIRKYLVLPNVLIIMAINIDQLKKCVEMEFRKQFSTLMNRQNPLSDNEFINMAAKYVEKLIPDGRKISLPEIRAISQSGNDSVELVYHKRGSLENILDKDNRKGIEERILGYIYDKTELVFIKPQNGVHRLIPNTLRGVVNLLSVLGKMEDIKEGESKREIQLSNILLFEDYFLHTWIPDNLDDGNMEMINELLSVSDFEKHRLLCVKVMDVIENHKVYTVDPKNNVNQLNTTLADLRDKYSKQNTNHMSYSLGDVFDILYILSTRYINTQTINLVFTIKTIYTLTMHKICLKEAEERKLCPNNIYRFVGDSLWGSRVTNALRGDRAKFLFTADEFLGEIYPKNGYFSQNKIYNDQEIKQMVILAFWARFPEVDKGLIEKMSNTETYEDALKVYEKEIFNQVLYKNNLIADNYLGRKNAELCIDNLFISFLDTEYLKVRSGFNFIKFTHIDWFDQFEKCVNLSLLQKIVINMELNEYVLQYSTEKMNYRSTAFDKTYLRHFIKRLDESLKENQYLNITKNGEHNKLFTDDSWKIDLMNSFVKCYNLKYPKKVDIKNELKNDKQNKVNDFSPNLLKENESFNLEVSYQEIDKVLNSKEIYKLNITPDMSNAKLKQLKNQTLVLARVVAYYNYVKQTRFDPDSINEIREIYVNCVFTDKIEDYGVRVARIQDLRERYMSVAYKMLSLIGNLDR
ncbi:hypothetical protein [Ruminiclostridium papyrosolvens]|uniref:KAP NTPase domain-containing protein n=1 Tax=Ruminiclostridium papyrosolvens C7 TaxID=1330534 RepID=U4R523_9FIRM|nr:hypothetical protein [Ruminiclostridium papyrosolvens]EPR13017.1 hypothetical protein L323_06620 [Ruminiclostridium papyrosolvens C7]